MCFSDRQAVEERQMKDTEWIFGAREAELCIAVHEASKVDPYEKMA